MVEIAGLQITTAADFSIVITLYAALCFFLGRTYSIGRHELKVTAGEATIRGFYFIARNVILPICIVFIILGGLNLLSNYQQYVFPPLDVGPWIIGSFFIFVILLVYANANKAKRFKYSLALIPNLFKSNHLIISIASPIAVIAVYFVIIGDWTSTINPIIIKTIVSIMGLTSLSILSYFNGAADWTEPS